MRTLGQQAALCPLRNWCSRAGYGYSGAPFSAGFASSLQQEPALANRLNVRSIQVDGHRFHDLVHGDDKPGSVLLLHQDAFPSRKGSMHDAHAVSKF